MEWISVNDRLPEMNVPVICYWNAHGSRIYVVCVMEDRNGYVGFIDYRISVSHPEITHWMPLPDPPKEEE